MSQFNPTLNLTYRKETVSEKYFLLVLKFCCTDLVRAQDDDLLHIAAIINTPNNFLVLYNRRLATSCPFCMAAFFATFEAAGKSITTDLSKERIYVCPAPV